MSSNNKKDDIDTLIAVALGEIQAPETRTEGEIFLDELDIQEGKNWVSWVRVYWLYLKWCEVTKRDPVNRVTFFKGIQKRHKKLMSEGRFYFRLKAEDFDMPKEEFYAAMKTYLKERKQWRANLKAKKTKAKNRREARLKRKQQKEAEQKTLDSKNTTSQE